MRSPELATTRQKPHRIINRRSLMTWWRRTPANSLMVPRALLSDRKSTRLNSSHLGISYAVFCLNDRATPEIYPLSLHDALPIYRIINRRSLMTWWRRTPANSLMVPRALLSRFQGRSTNTFLSNRSEEHTSELQSL